jgi:hypothetical protein
MFIVGGIPFDAQEPYTEIRPFRECVLYENNVVRQGGLNRVDKELIIISMDRRIHVIKSDSLRMVRICSFK